MTLRNQISYFILLLIFFINPAFSEQLIIEPDMGRAPILAAINHATHSIQLVMYGLTDQECIAALLAAKNKNLQIILEKSPYKATDENAAAINQLQQHKVDLIWPNPEYQLTHQKTFIFDHKTALVMTFNLTHSSFTKERNFALLTDNPDIVQEIEHVFIADKQHLSASVKNSNLAWCPNNCRTRILTLINSAQHTIQVYAQDITDYQVTGALAKAARNGVNVKLILSAAANKPKNNKRFHYLTQSGVVIHFNQRYIIHAKVIIIDQQRALLGSINLTEPSINDNRELSILTTDPTSLKELNKTFADDWMS
jgi:cardiolipin synthase